METVICETNIDASKLSREECYWTLLPGVRRRSLFWGGVGSPTCFKFIYTIPTLGQWKDNILEGTYFTVFLKFHNNAF